MVETRRRRVRWGRITIAVTVIYMAGCRYMYSTIPPGLPLSNFRMFGISSMPLMMAWQWLFLIWALDEGVRWIISQLRIRQAIHARLEDDASEEEAS